jgi:hypothetical protein
MLIMTMMLGLAIATTGAVSASAGDFAKDFFEQLSRDHN